MFFIGAAICYIALLILVLRAVSSSAKSVSHNSQNTAPLLSQKQKQLILCLVLALFLFTFLAFFTLNLKSGESIWTGAAGSALASVLFLLKPRNLILFGMLLLLLFQDKKREKQRKAENSRESS